MNAPKTIKYTNSLGELRYVLFIKQAFRFFQAMCLYIRK